MAGIESARFEAQLLLALALGVTRTAVLAETYAAPTEEQRERFQYLVEERAKRVPLAYLRGTQEFFGLDFEVSPAVLIPRPETELLVEFALKRLPESEPALFADVGTGSGCIAVTILKHRPQARAIATDLSEEALTVARKNAAQHGVLARVTFVQTETLTGIGGPLDLIVSNPPYILTGEIAGLQVEVRDREPTLALDGGEDGLRVLRTLAQQGREVLRPGGGLAVEVAMGQAAQVVELFQNSHYTTVNAQNDLAGIPRMVSGNSAETGHHLASPCV